MMSAQTRIDRAKVHCGGRGSLRGWKVMVGIL
jgi:hypothetical protein